MRCRFTPTCVGTCVISLRMLDVPARFTPTCVGNVADLGSTIRRFTPTCVGNVSVGHSCECRFTPTCVGNVAQSWRSAQGMPGSPPRAWGMCRRSGYRTRSCADTVHPHVRGECSLGRRRRGSPPRAWGIRRRGWTHVGSPPRAWGMCRRRSTIAMAVHRFTPTCVGNVLRNGQNLHRQPMSLYDPSAARPRLR